MRRTSLTSLVLATLTLTFAFPLQLPSNISLGSDLPDPRFSITKNYDATTLLPVDPALLNVLHFMGTIASQGFHEILAPRIYSAPGYRQVQIKTYAWTEVRFLLWGIYTAIGDMISSARFHDTRINLYWDGNLVGRISLGVKSTLSLPVTSDNRTISINENNTNSSALFPDPQMNASAFAPELDITLHPLTGARPIDRNDAFLTFYTALLHVALYRSADEMEAFDSKFPAGNVWIDMYETGAGCQVNISFLWLESCRMQLSLTAVVRASCKHISVGREFHGEKRWV